ncbi:glutaminase A [Brevibacillus choshinensis]|uniref:glutaminase A n=1 Tax=Brevibacillus choshinensis TaxID=54911 RepID=UPI002E205EFF|nr:glutaminase A [Brevibacillus choshinensis]MED4755173.1 glutaminase A [Brevibacillus choshinensis]MED4784160.1 glutaminase A [Brevibacillus choshinensis]
MIQANKKTLQRILDDNRKYTADGKVADYIPELGHANPAALGFTLATKNDGIASVGDCDTTFTLQSISKVISLLVALLDHGPKKVFAKVGMEPSGDPFNSIIKLETMDHHKPLNPMINAGAIAIASMIAGNHVAERFQRVCELLHLMTANTHISLNEQVYRSEKATGDRNRSLAYFMKSTGIIETDVEEALDLYFQLCSIQVRCSDLAKIGLFLANWGRIEGKDSPLVDPCIVQILLTIMMTSGMYNASGEFAIHVGIPAKSGVSGGILAVVPNKMGIGVIGPAIDDKGNSVAGMRILEDLSKEYGLHVFSEG